MATRSKSKSKKKVRATSKVGGKSAGFGKKSLKSELQRAIGFLRRGKLEKAYAVLMELEQSYPDTPDVFVELANYYAAVGNLSGYQSTCERLIALDPHQSLFTVGLAQSYLATGSPMLALKTFRQVAEKWPNHSEIDSVQNSIKELEAGVEACLAELKLENNAEGLATAEEHEQIQCYLNRAEFDRAKEAGLALLERTPQIKSVRNNVSMACFFEGQFEEAIAQGHKVLEDSKDNIHALSNLIRYHYVLGDEAAARALVPRLLSSEADAYDPWTKKMEALSYLGDYEQVLNLYDLGLESGEIKENSLYDFFYHLGAVAIARVDDLGTARKIWESLNKRSAFQAAVENLADSNQAIAQRHGAWSFEFNQWISPVIIEKLTETLQEVIEIEKRAKDEEEKDASIQALFNTFLDQYPYFNRLIPVWLERGSPQARSFAFMVAKTVQRPEHLEALKEFALGKWGPDDMRYQAAIAASQAKVLDKKVTLWLQGKQREIILMAYEFHSEVPESHDPEVEKMLIHGIDRFKEARETDDEAVAASIYQEVEETMQKAIALESDAPDLKNNLAACYHAQGKQEEAIALLEQIIQDSPMYVHARTSRAKAYLAEADIESAQELLLPMLEWERFHIEDFSEFSDVYLQYLMAQGQEDGARSWLNMWQEVNPESPKLFSWFLRLTDPEDLQRIMESQGME